MSSRHRFAMAGVASVLVSLWAMAGLVRAEEEPSGRPTLRRPRPKPRPRRSCCWSISPARTGAGWCKKLKREVFDKEGFKTEAPKQFVLVELDFPHTKKLSEELQKQNGELRQSLQDPRLPHDSGDGRRRRSGRQDRLPRPAARRNTCSISRSSRRPTGRVLKMKQELAEAKGLDRAKLLDQLVDAYVKLNNETDQLQDLERGDRRPGRGQQGRAEEQAPVPHFHGRVRRAEGGSGSGTRPRPPPKRPWPWPASPASRSRGPMWPWPRWLRCGRILPAWWIASGRPWTPNPSSPEAASTEGDDRPLQAGGRGPGDLHAKLKAGAGESQGPGPRQDPRPADRSPGRARLRRRAVPAKEISTNGRGRSSPWTPKTRPD